jgi:hypothetical protein
MVESNSKQGSQNNNSVEDNLSKDYISNNLKQKIPVTNEIKEALQKKEADKTKKEIQELNKEILKKFPFIEALGIVSVNVSKNLEENMKFLKKIEKRI